MPPVLPFRRAGSSVGTMEVSFLLLSFLQSQPSCRIDHTLGTARWSQSATEWVRQLAPLDRGSQTVFITMLAQVASERMKGLCREKRTIRVPRVLSHLVMKPKPPVAFCLEA